MSNIFTYLRKYRNVDFERENFTIIDALAFTGIIYLPLPKRPSKALRSTDTLKHLLQEFVDHPTAYKLCVMPTMDMKFARTIIRTNRFNSVKMYGYYESIDTAEQKQFRACTFVKDDLSQIFIAFCGTDTTLVGWKEDFNMALKKETPSQHLAVKYIKDIANKFPDAELFIGGHSKGGNLAMYGATYSSKEIKDRIVHIFNFDGPGFTPDMLKSRPYQQIRDKITTILPYYSLVGILFEQSDDYRIIQSGSIGFLNHALYSWETNGTDFKYSKKLSNTSAKTAVIVKQAMTDLTWNEREAFLDNFYAMMTHGGAKTTHEMLKDIVQTLRGANAAFTNMTEKTQDKVVSIFMKWISIYFRPMNKEEKRYRKQLENNATYRLSDGSFVKGRKQYAKRKKKLKRK